MMLLQIQWLLLLRILSSTVAHAVPASPSAPTKTAEKSILSCTSFTQKVTIQAGVTVLYAQTPITATKNIAHSAATSECAKLLTEAFNLYNNNKHNDNGGKYPDQTNFNFEFPQTFIQQNHLSIFSSSGRETIQTNHNSVNPSPTKITLYTYTPTATPKIKAYQLNDMGLLYCEYDYPCHSKSIGVTTIPGGVLASNQQKTCVAATPKRTPCACTAYTITNVLHSTPSFTATPANSLTTSLMLDRDSTESVQASLKQQCQNAYSTLEYYILYEIDTNLNGRDNQAGVFAENVAVPVYYSTKTVPGTRYGKIATATKSGVYTSYSFYTHGTPTIHVTEEVGGTAIECGYTLSLKSSSARVTVPAMELGYTQVTICEPTLSIGQLSD